MYRFCALLFCSCCHSHLYYMAIFDDDGDADDVHRMMTTDDESLFFLFLWCVFAFAFAFVLYIIYTTHTQSV